MKANLIHSISILAVISLLSACATDGSSKQVSNKPLTEIEKQMSQIMAASASQEMFFVEVASPNNVISEKIMLASIALGDGSAAINQLSELLKKNAVIHIGIVGKSQSINIMTVKESLKKLAGKPAKGTVYLIADTKTKEELITFNQNQNVSIVVVNE